jgi:hypothetical protein
MEDENDEEEFQELKEDEIVLKSMTLMKQLKPTAVFTRLPPPHRPDANIYNEDETEEEKEGKGVEGRGREEEKEEEQKGKEEEEEEKKEVDKEEATVKVSHFVMVTFGSDGKLISTSAVSSFYVNYYFFLSGYCFK